MLQKTQLILKLNVSETFDKFSSKFIMKSGVYLVFYNLWIGETHIQRIGSIKDIDPEVSIKNGYHLLPNRTGSDRFTAGTLGIQ